MYSPTLPIFISGYRYGGSLTGRLDFLHGGSESFRCTLKTRDGLMPPKIRELIADLENAGFVNRSGKGSHRNFVHPSVRMPVTISGSHGDDAKHLSD